MPLQLFEVTYQVRALVPDTGPPDLGLEPELMPVQGTVTFTPPIGILADDGAGAVAVNPQTFGVVDGLLLDGGGNEGVALLSPYSTGLNVQGWKWTATFNLKGVTQPAPVQVSGAPGATVELDDAAPVSMVGGTPVLRGPRGLQGIQGPAGPAGGVQMINGVVPDGSGNVALTAANVAAEPAISRAGATAGDVPVLQVNSTFDLTPLSSGLITDFVEAVQDTVAAFITAGTGVTITYDDAANSYTITTGAGGTTDAEIVRDTIGTALIGVGLISVTVNDAADTITIATTATANSTDATLLSRANHTGSQAISTVSGLQTALDAKTTRVLTKRTITGNYTLVLADATDMVLHTTSASALTITLPQDSSVAIAQETPIPWRQYGAGQITFAAGTGATLVSRGSVFKSAGQYAEGLLTKTAANTWLVSGDLVA